MGGLGLIPYIIPRRALLASGPCTCSSTPTPDPRLPAPCPRDHLARSFPIIFTYDPQTFPPQLGMRLAALGRPVHRNDLTATITAIYSAFPNQYQAVRTTTRRFVARKLDPLGIMATQAVAAAAAAAIDDDEPDEDEEEDDEQESDVE